MILANALLSTAGRAADSFIMLDLMRLPLGILAGMGFIGAGAIIRRDNLVLGVTTAATLWFVTVMGLCFGAAQIWLGVGASLLGVGILSGMKRLESSLKQYRQATLAVIAGEGGSSDDDIRSCVSAAGYQITSWSIVYGRSGKDREVTCLVQWRGRPSETEIRPGNSNTGKSPRYRKARLDTTEPVKIPG